MSDIVAFTRARLDEDEQTASAAPDGPWNAWRGRPGLGLPHGLDYAVTLPGQTSGHVAEIATRSWLAAAHIARHDPSRVLREVAAKRAILDQFEQARSDHRDTPASPVLAAVRSTLRGVVNQLAAEWSDHPDYDTAWSVTL